MFTRTGWLRPSVDERNDLLADANEIWIIGFYFEAFMWSYLYIRCVLMIKGHTHLFLFILGSSSLISGVVQLFL